MQRQHNWIRRMNSIFWLLCFVQKQKIGSSISERIPLKYVLGFNRVCGFSWTKSTYQMGLSFTMQVPAQWICNSLCSMFNKNGISNGFVVYHAGTNPMDMKFVVTQFNRDLRGKSTRNLQSYRHINAQTFCFCVCENYGLHHCNTNGKVY